MKRREQEDPEVEGTHILEESRMVLPGVQALFGFQLIAFFTPVFQELPWVLRTFHLVATGLTAISIMLILAPAAYQRQAEPHTLSVFFVSLATKLLTAGMFTLTAGICIEFYLVTRLTLHDGVVPALLATSLMTLFMVAWFVLPRVARRRHRENR